MSKIDLRLGDCLEVMKTIEDNSIDTIILKLQKIELKKYKIN